VRAGIDVLRARALRSSDDAGFTLVELLMSIVILGVIMAPLTGVVLTYFRNADATSARLNESHDAQITAAWFSQDVQALGVRDYTAPGPYFPLLQSVETGVAADGGSHPCGAAGTPDALVRFAWDDFSDSTLGSRSQTRVVYVVEGTELHRVRCDGSAAGVTSDVVVAHNVTAASVACATASGGTGCTGAGAQVPTAVSLLLTIRDPKSAADYPVTLTGQRRQS
jgi:prepilin-type N-terminal cleavage/methylation domain-containing protein